MTMEPFSWLTFMTTMLIIIQECVGNVTAQCPVPTPPCSNCKADVPLENAVSFPVATYFTWTCDDGFYMVGNGDSVVWVCSIDGEWLGNTPNCTEIYCPSPPIPAHGSLSYEPLEFYRPGDIINFQCDSDYDLTGSETSTCLPNGTWSNEGQFCKINCNAKISYQDGNTCFQVRYNKKNWGNAGTQCSSDGGFLALVKDDETQEFLKLNLQGATSESLWIGAKEDRHWEWTYSSQYIRRLFWNEGEPNNYFNRNEDCIELTAAANGWNDENCGTKNGHICQLATCVEDHSDPDIHQVMYRGACYQFFDGSYTWNEGRQNCENTQGSHMVEIFDKSTQDFVSKEANEFKRNRNWWIGGKAVNSNLEERSWFWVDNTRVSKFQWGIGEPNDVNTEECIELGSNDDRQWNDLDCSVQRYSVCQFGLPSCGDPGEPLHGSRSPSDTTAFLDGATIDYYCDPGYEVIGNTSATCMLNGQWNTERPTCQVITCPNNTLPVDNTANVTISSNMYRGVAVYTCTFGYIPDASPVSYCQADKTWSYPNFTCKAIPPCYSEPCLNGATCTEIDGVFSCHCAVGFTGEECEIAITTQATAPPSTTFPYTDLASTSTNFPSSAITTQATASPSTTFPYTDLASASTNFPSSGSTGFTTEDSATFVTSERTERISTNNHLFTSSVTETSTLPSDGDPQPQSNVAAAAGGAAAVFIIIILVSLALAVNRGRKRPNSKTDGKMSMNHGMVLKPEENKYNDIMKPAFETGADNTAFIVDTAGYSDHGDVTGTASSSKGSKAVPFGNETEGIGADMMENALYEASDSPSVQEVHDGPPKVQFLGDSAKFFLRREDSTSKVGREVASSKSIPPYTQVNKFRSQMVDNELYGETENGGRHMVSGAHGNGFKDTGNPQTESNSAPNDGMIDNEVYAPSSNDAIYHELEENDQMVDNEIYGETENDGRHMVSGAHGNGFKDTGNPQTDSNSAPNDGMIDNEVYAPSSNDAIYHELEENDQPEVIYEVDFRGDGVDDGMVDNTLYSASDVIDHEGDQSGTVYENTEYHDVPENLVENELYTM